MSTHYHKPDYFLFAVIAIIVVFGLVMLSSASNAIGYKEHQDSYFFLKHQLLHGLLPGLILLLFFWRVDYRRWQKRPVFWLVISFVLLLSVFVPKLGTSYTGEARSWLIIPGLFSFQPAEIAKLTFILFLAGWLAKRPDGGLKDWRRDFAPFILAVGLAVGLVILQPDLGTALILAAIAIAMYFVAGGSLKHLTWLGLTSGALLALLIKSNPYWEKRLLTFLNPGLDTQDIGYHLNQALLAIGSGGWAGRGFNQSRQKFLYLPEVYGDSIFAVIAEELGFVVVLMMISLWMIIIYRGFKLAKRAPDYFGQLLVKGIIFWFGFQALVNIGSMLGLMPMTGLPLPFISYGGTALVTSLGAVGLLVNVSRQGR